MNISLTQFNRGTMYLKTEFDVLCVRYEKKERTHRPRSKKILERLVKERTWNERKLLENNV